MLAEDEYATYNKQLGENNTSISNTWKTWNESVFNLMYDKPDAGPSSSSIIGGRNIVNRY